MRNRVSQYHKSGPCRSDLLQNANTIRDTILVDVIVYPDITANTKTGCYTATAPSGAQHIAAVHPDYSQQIYEPATQLHLLIVCSL